MKKYLFALIVLLSATKLNAQQNKGTCTAPYAILTAYSSFTTADAAYQSNKRVWSPAETGTINTFAEVNSGPDGKIGFDLSHHLISLTDPNCINNNDREIRLFLKSTGACNWSSGITPSAADGGNGASWSNPEFYGLTPNVAYIAQVRTIVPAGDCSVDEQYLTYYQITDPIIPVGPCGTVGFDWKLGQSPTPPSTFECTDNTNYSLKADVTGSTAGDEGSYIAPGFTIYNDAGVSIYDIQVKEGPSSYFPVYPSKIVTYCVPSYTYLIKLNGSGSGNIIIKDNATANVLNTTAFSDGMVITLAPGTIKGSSIFSGIGVSNYKKGEDPSTYIGSGYGVFNPSVAGGGTHTITYSWDNGAGCSGTSTMQVTVDCCTPPAINNQPSNSTICAGGNTNFSVNATGATSYQWQVNTGSGWNNVNNGSIYTGSTTNNLAINGATNNMSGYQYQCIISNASTACSSNSTAVILTVLPVPNANLGSDQCIENGSITLYGDNSSPDFQYLWSNGSSGTTLSVNTSGFYSVTISSGNGLCVDSDSVSVKVFNNHPIIELGENIEACSHKPVVLNAAQINEEANFVYEWYPSNNSSGSTYSFQPGVAGTYWIKATKTACTTVSDSVEVTLINCSVTVPNAFTPNGDSYNETFYIKGLEEYPNTNLSVYNRWGKLIYESSNYQNNWDGNNAADGTYYYIITYPPKTFETASGTVNIIRDGK
ncbi:MAG: gliding motility-associated C-terminal domain-containing protein [Bacteroidota bacterium]